MAGNILEGKIICVSKVDRFLVYNGLPLDQFENNDWMDEDRNIPDNTTDNSWMIEALAAGDGAELMHCAKHNRWMSESMAKFCAEACNMSCTFVKKVRYDSRVVLVVDERTFDLGVSMVAEELPGMYQKFADPKSPIKLTKEGWDKIWNTKGSGREYVTAKRKYIPVISLQAWEDRKKIVFF